MGWKSIEIPAKLIGEERCRKVGMREYAQRQVFLPEKSEYAGYMFWYPEKLVSRASDGRSAILRYEECSFTFKLEMRHREPGRRYRRYVLDVAAFEEIYLPQQENVLSRRRKKQEAMDAQTGEVLLHCRVGYNRADIWSDFRPYKGKQKRQVAGVGVETILLAENVKRMEFKRCLEALEAGEKELEMVAWVRAQLESGTYRHVESMAKEQLLGTARTAWADRVRDLAQLIEEYKTEGEKK